MKINVAGAINNERKTKELIVHICDRLKGEKTFGSIVLNKVLYFIDNLRYQEKGMPISGFDYIRQNNGPTPKPIQFLSIREDLISDGSLKIEQRKYFSTIQKVPKALRNADLTDFLSDEILLIEDVIDAFRDVNASVASGLTHEFMAWRIAKPMEDLPFHTFLLGTGSEDLTEEDLKWIKESISNRRNAAA